MSLPRCLNFLSSRCNSIFPCFIASITSIVFSGRSVIASPNSFDLFVNLSRIFAGVLCCFSSFSIFGCEYFTKLNVGSSFLAVDSTVTIPFPSNTVSLGSCMWFL